MKLNASAVKALTLPSGVKEKTFFDDALGGFGVRLRDGGSANYVVQYDIAGKTKRVTLGSTAMLDVGVARGQARDLLASVRRGGDPAADKRARHAEAAATFGALLPRYLAKVRAESRPRSAREIEARLNKLARALHPRPLTSIDRRAISSLLADVAERSGPSAAINLHGSLSGYFTWLIQAGLLNENPTVNAAKPDKRPSRERVIREAELRTVWAALGEDDYGDIVKLLVLTACRRGEIGGLRWDEVDLEEAVIEIPGARMKNGKPHVVPLSKPALVILAKRQRNGRDHVFGRGSSGFQGWSHRRRALDDGIAGKRPDWVLHDLRRLASTVMHDKLGIPPHIVERVLAHVGHQSGIAGTYNKAEYLTEKRRALERWGQWVEGVVTGEPAETKVIQLGRKR
jgi:integrase